MKKTILLYFIISLCSFTYELKTELNFDYILREDIEKTSSINADIILEEEFENYTLDIEYKISEEKNHIDLAKLKYSFENSEFEMGRLRLGWGVGFNFNPVDIFNKKELGSNFSSSYNKNGRDSILYRKYFDESSLEMIYAFKNNEFSEDYAIKYKRTVGDYDLEGYYLHIGERKIEKEDDILAFTLRGSLDLFDMGIWNEFAYYSEKEDYDMSLGLDLYFKEIYYFNLEYYRNYIGEKDKNKYKLNLLEYGELLGKDYIIPSLNIEISEKITNTIYSFINLNDSSVMLGDSFVYRYDDNINIELNPYFYIAPKNTEFYIFKKNNSYGLNLKLQILF